MVTKQCPILLNKTKSTLSSIAHSNTLFLFLSPLGESPRRGIEVGEGRGRGQISRKI